MKWGWGGAIADICLFCMVYELDDGSIAGTVLQKLGVNDGAYAVIAMDDWALHGGVGVKEGN